MAGKVDKTTYVADFAQMLETNGSKKLSGGSILQWGKTPVIATGNAYTTVTFPIAFPNACLNANATVVGENTNSIAAIGKPPTNTQVEIYHDDVAGGTACPAFWFAIGY